jgi:hypothetical protein
MRAIMRTTKNCTIIYLTQVRFGRINLDALDRTSMEKDLQSLASYMAETTRLPEGRMGGPCHDLYTMRSGWHFWTDGGDGATVSTADKPAQSSSLHMGTWRVPRPVPFCDPYFHMEAIH